MIEHVVKETANRFEKIDILVNHSGISWMAAVFEMPDNK
jgi:NAD(P)-dependent dehydrogenase (short-subunit alcohol dehydrogenase family)